jgi:hypothetical protein
LVFAVLADVDGYFFRLVASGLGLGPATFDEGVDSVHLPLLVEQSFGEVLTLALVLGLVFLVLADDFLVVLGPRQMPLLG